MVCNFIENILPEFLRLQQLLQQLQQLQLQPLRRQRQRQQQLQQPQQQVQRQRQLQQPQQQVQRQRQLQQPQQQVQRQQQPQQPQQQVQRQQQLQQPQQQVQRQQRQRQPQQQVQRQLQQPLQPQQQQLRQPLQRQPQQQPVQHQQRLLQPPLQRQQQQQQKQQRLQQLQRQVQRQLHRQVQRLLQRQVQRQVQRQLLNNYNGVPYGSPTYTTSVLGHGAAISFTASSSQYVTVTVKQVLFNSTSFTIEAWIYPISLTATDFGIFGQCQSASTNLCLHFTTRNVMLYCGFYANDVAGSTTLTMNRWSHVACLYDLSTGLQQVWLNGVLDGSRTTTAFQGVSTATTIGMVSYPMPTNYYFNGYLDQVRYEPRAKSQYELLNDATLSAHYSFDGGSILDEGPNGINLTSSGTITTIAGRVNQALQFSSGSYLYVPYTSFYFLGVSNYPFTLSVWVKPTGSYASSTIMFVNAGWCVGVLTMTSSGNIMANLWNGGPTLASGPVIPLNSWTHVGYTYSSGNGLRLYVNGNLYSTSGAIAFSASGALATIVIAGNAGLNSCSPGYGGPFTGALDEFYIYSRELTAAQILALANP
ncbi:unnamed protein product [Rotaria magnacalcarata]